VALGSPLARRRVEFAIPAGARAREAVIGPKDEHLYLILDRGEARDLARMSLDGSGAPQVIVRDYDAHIWSFAVAPDAKTLVVWDKAARLQKIDVATGAITLLARNVTGEDDAFDDLVFSPDGRFIAYAEIGPERFRNSYNLKVQNLATGALVQATSGKFIDYAPAFSKDGAWLYFISERNFDPTPGSPWGDRNMGIAFNDRGELYALQLDPAAEFPFRQANELSGADDDAEEEATDEEGTGKKDEDEDKDGKKAKKPAARIVLDGLADRLYKLPVKPGVSDRVLVSEDFLYTHMDDKWVSIAIDKSQPEIETFSSTAGDLQISADRKTLAVVLPGKDAPHFALVPAKAKLPEKLDGTIVRLDDWRLTIDPVAEWQRIYADAWRMHRDFAYDPALRGVDWNAVRAAHAPLVERIGHRAELNTILGQMAWNLGILHSQVRAGDLPEDEENSELAFLGAEYETVPEGLRIRRIYRAEADLVSLRPPLLRPDVDAREGDIIRRVDGRTVASLGELRLALASKAGQQVRLDLERGGRTVSTIVEPMDAAGRSMALYHDFTEGRKAAAEALGGGEIGYVKLRAMTSDDLASFARDYFAQLDKPGLIIDVRNNSGGNIDSLLIAMLQRRPWAFWGPPDGVGVAYTNMQNAYRGHIAVLIDERTYSDGETFAGAIKALGIAPLVGMRTAGAGIWLSGRNPLVDGGMVRIAEFAQYDIEGNWIVEGYGVAPDYPVENPPFATYNGADAQMEAAIGLLRQKIAAEPIPELKPRPLPPLGTPGRDVRLLD
jgi:tricorn protease